MEVKDLILNHKKAAEDYLVQKRDIWTEHENLMHNKLSDQISQITKSQIFDPVLSTVSMYRSFRVMAQFATGKVKGISKNDRGAEKLMNLTLDKYIVPNANAQFTLLTKFRMVDMYSDVYGNFFCMVDWDVKPNGYIGPDIWLIPIRDVFPQVGAVSIEDSDRIVIRSWRSLSFFEGLTDKNAPKEAGYRNISEIVTKLKDKPGDKQNRDASTAISARENAQYPTQKPAKGEGFYEVLSMYEGDRWIDFVTSAEMEFRDRKNPHDNGELPVVNKYSIPLLDDFMGMGGYERGKPMQLGTNSLWNLYLDACKVSIFPPVMFNKDQIAEKASIKWSAAAKWMMKGNPALAAQVLNLTPQGIQTFNNTMQNMKASLLNTFGTTDTTVKESTDPGFGRTPEALKMQATRESTGDNVDRYFMEEFVTKVYRKFVNLMSKKGDKVQIRMWDEEIADLVRQYPDLKENYDEGTGKLSVDKKKVGSIIYDYEIVPGSTYMVDQKNQQENLIELFKSVTQNLQINQQTGEVISPLIQALKSEGKEVKIGEMFTRLIANAGIQDWDKIIVEKTDSEQADGVLKDAQAKFMAAIQQLAGGNVPGAPAQPGTGMPPGMPTGAPAGGAPIPGMPMGGGMPNGQNQ